MTPTTPESPLADRLRMLLEGAPNLTEKAMFGGRAFMIGGNITIGTWKVADLDPALEAVRARGGAVRVGPTGDPAAWRYAVIEDPAGALLGLFWTPDAPTAPEDAADSAGAL